MESFYSRSCRGLIVRCLLLAASAVCPAIARAQGARDQEPAAEEINVPGVPSPLDVDVTPMTKQQFDEWADRTVFAPHQTGGEWYVQRVSRLELKLEFIQRTCGITPEQVKKLRFAGLGDIKRMIETVEAHKRSFVSVRGDQVRLTTLQADVLSLHDKSATSLWEGDSLLVKTMRKSLTGEQLGRYLAAARDSKLYRHQANVDKAVQLFDIRVGMNDQQRRMFSQLLFQKTRPARRLADPLLELLSIGFQAARLPEATIKPIFDDAQWRSVKTVFQEITASSEIGGVDLEDDLAGAIAAQTAVGREPPKVSPDRNGR